MSYIASMKGMLDCKRFDSLRSTCRIDEMISAHWQVDREFYKSVSRKSVCPITIVFVLSLLAISQVPQRVFIRDRPGISTSIVLESNHRWVTSSQRLPGYQDNPGRKLIESIKEARRRASGTSCRFERTVVEDEGGSVTKDVRGLASDNCGVSDCDQPVCDDGEKTENDVREREEWTRQNPCMSRLELMPLYNERKHAKQLLPNPLWEELLSEYSRLHRACIKRVGNLTDYFLTGNVSIPGCRFAVAAIAPNTGLGNKIFVTVSSVLYAILTQRVVLIPSSTLLPDSTCEPFVGSSWVLNSEDFPVPSFFHGSDFKKSLWTEDTDFFKEIDQVLEKLDDQQITLEKFETGFLVPAKRLENAVGVLTQEWQPQNRFYCSAEQTFYSQSTWVYLSGCIYTIPKLFATPLFRPVLEELFPDKMALTRLLRSLFLPADVVWGRVRRVNRAYLADADRRVGIQVRYKDGVEHYNRMNSLVNERIMNCSQSFANILPDLNSSRFRDSNLSPENASSPPEPLVKVFVASLFPGLYDHLSRMFVRYPSLTGEKVALVQVSQDLAQTLEDVEEDQQAFTEVLLLSLSDQLIVTPVSTFGGLAQAYGALTPWFVEMRENDGTESLRPCERGQTVDVCNQFTDKVYMCPHDPAVDKKRFSDVVPYIKDCLTIDHDQGIQLITDFQS